ncbi:uncharacterized protein LOC125026162 [Penaeus chinensis]|uniref:uncharacterized protein LOC125026162 n=1 Tax=Penaeus chinensis TaxID=139456 RepID=UPI001FB7808B|nr:uncharacterized protein LOC125026162 [Penaeus chinensis]
MLHRFPAPQPGASVCCPGLEVFKDGVSNHSPSGEYGNGNDAVASSDESPHVLVNVWSIVDGQLQKTGTQRVPASAFVEGGLPNNSMPTTAASTISPIPSSLSVPSFPFSSSSSLSSSFMSTHPPSSLALTPPAGRPQNNGFTGTHNGGSGNSHPTPHILSPLNTSQSQFQSIGELLKPVPSYLQQQISNQDSGESASQMDHLVSLPGHQSGSQSHQQFPAFTHQDLLSHRQRNYSASQSSQGSKIAIPNYQQTSIQFQESPVFPPNPDSQHQGQSEVSGVGSDLPQPLDNFDDYVTLLQILGANIYPSGLNSSTPSLQAILSSLQNATSTEPLNQPVNHNIFPNKTRFPGLPINTGNTAEVFQSQSKPNPIQQNQHSQLLNRLHGNLQTYPPLQTHSRPPASSSQSGLSFEPNPSYSIPNPQISDKLSTHKTNHPSSQRQHLHHSFQLHSQNTPYPQGNQHVPSNSQYDVSNPQMPLIYEQMVLKDTQPPVGDQSIWNPAATADQFSELHSQPGQVKPTVSTFSNLMNTLSQHLLETPDLQSGEYTHITAPSILANLPFLSDAPSSGEMQHVLENLHTLQNGQTKTSTEPSRLPWGADSPRPLGSAGLASASQPLDSQTIELQGSSPLPSAYTHGLPPVKDNNRANVRHPQVKNSNVSSINDLNLFSYTSSPNTLKINNTSDMDDTYALTALQLIHNSTKVSLSTSPSTHMKLPTQQPPVLKPFSAFSYQPPLGANEPTHIWPLGTQEQNLNFGQASYQPKIPPPVFLQYPQTTTSFPRTSTVNSVPFGGVGNPGLLGVPIGLQENSHSFIAQTHLPTKPPATQVFGGVGNDALKGYPVHISGNFENAENEGFVSLSNHNPLINSPPSPAGLSNPNPAISSADLSPQILAELQELQALNAIFAGAGESPAEEAMKIVALQSLLTKNPHMLEHLFLKPNVFNSRQGQPLIPEPTSQDVVDPVDNSGYPSNFDPMHHNIGFKTEIDDKGSGQDITPRPGFQSGAPIDIHPGSPNHMIPNSDEVNINFSELPPEHLLYLMQHFGRLPPTLQELEEALSDHPRVPVTLAEPSHNLPAQSTVSPFGLNDGTHRESQGQVDSHISSDAKVEPTATENSFLSNRYVQGCLGNKWCALGLAMTVAVGATGAMAAPLVVPVLGRRRRDVGDDLQNIFEATSSFDREMNLYATLMKEPSISSYDEQVNHNLENSHHEPPDPTSASENRTNSTDMLDFHENSHPYDAMSSPLAKLEEETLPGRATGFVPSEQDLPGDESIEALYVFEYDDDAYLDESFDEPDVLLDDKIDDESDLLKAATKITKNPKDKGIKCLQENMCLGMVVAADGVAFLTPFLSRKRGEVLAGMELGDRIVQEMKTFLPPSDQDLPVTRTPSGTASWRKQRMQLLVDKVVHLFPAVEKLFEIFHQAKVKPKHGLMHGISVT